MSSSSGLIEDHTVCQVVAIWWGDACHAAVLATQLVNRPPAARVVSGAQERAMSSCCSVNALVVYRSSVQRQIRLR
jgi:hypothetical protein